MGLTAQRDGAEKNSRVKKQQRIREEGISSKAFNELWEPTISP
jgi:hypothetical protein